MEEITINKFEIQSARTDCFIAVTELEKLFGSLESGEIPEDLGAIKRYTLDRLRKRHTRLLAVEAESMIEAR